MRLIISIVLIVTLPTLVLAHPVQEEEYAYQAMVNQRDTLAWILAVIVTLATAVKVLTYLLWRSRRKLMAQLEATNQQLEDRNASLEQLNREKDKLFGIIAHDLRGPIASFSKVPTTFNYLVQTGQFQDLDRLSKMVERSAFELNIMLDSLLNWALSQQGKLQPVIKTTNLANVVERTGSIYGQVLMTKRIRFSSKIPAGLAIETDGELLFIVIRNLVSNAIKFSSADSTITIEARAAGSEVVVSVTDQGIGMSAEQVSKLFVNDREKRRTGTAGEVGSGLGMVMIADLVKSLGGRIEVSSKPDHGTTFMLFLPAMVNTENHHSVVLSISR